MDAFPAVVHREAASSGAASSAAAVADKVAGSRILAAVAASDLECAPDGNSRVAR